MNDSLFSPLSIKECVSRLEDAKKNQVVGFSRTFAPPKCDVKGNSFILRKNYAWYVPHMNGDLLETQEGTLIRYSLEIDSTTRQLNSLFLAIGLPITACFILAIILDGFMEGFSWNLLFALFVAISIPSFYYLMRQLGNRQSEIDKEEMLEFLQKTLDVKSNMS